MPRAHRTARILFHVGGPGFHPVADQAQQIAQWLGPEFQCDLHDGLAAFDALDPTYDLLVLMGLHWTGMTRDWCPVTYDPMRPPQQRAFEDYVASGRPILAHHGAVASYDDWPRFGELVGVTWVWGQTSHSPVGKHTVRVKPTNHPVIEGVSDFEIFDELYYNLRLTRDLPAQVHATATWDGAQHPMVITAEGGRTDGAGKLIYLANGHDMKAFEAPEMRRLWVNTVHWLLQR